MRRQCKITWTKDLWDFIISKMVLAVKEMRSKSFISEEWYDEHGFPMDTTVEGKEAPRVFTLNQLHMHRHMILSGRSIRSYFNDVLERKRVKMQNVEDHKCTVARKYIERNLEAERKLKAMVSLKGADGSTIVEWNKLELRVKHFQKLTGPLLIAFIQVRHQEDLVGQPLLELPTTKGTVEKVVQENIP